MNFLNITLAICLCMTSLAFAQPIYEEQNQIADNAVGTWGLKDGEGEWIIAPIYDTLYPLTSAAFNAETYVVTRYKSDFFLAKRGKKMLLLHKDGSLRYKADAILPRLMGSTLLVKSKDKWGLISTAGRKILPVKCAAIAWHEDVLALKEKGKWRLFDPQEGRLDPYLKLDRVELISKPNKAVLLLVEKEGKKGILDEHLRTIVTVQYNKLTLRDNQTNYIHYENDNGTCGKIHLRTGKVEQHTCLP